MKTLLVATCLSLLLVAAPEAARAADLPDVLLSTVEGSRVEVTKTSGETLVGLLKTFDASVVVLILDDRSIVAVERRELVGVSLAEAAPAGSASPAPAPAPSAAPPPSGVAASSSPPPPAPSGGGLPAPPKPPPPPSEEALKAQAQASQDAERRNQEVTRKYRAFKAFGGVATGLMIGGLVPLAVGGLMWGVSASEIDDGDDSLDAQLAFHHGQNMVRVGAPLTITGFTMALVFLAVPTSAWLSQRPVDKERRLARRLRPRDPRFGAGPLPGGAALSFSMRF